MTSDTMELLKSIVWKAVQSVRELLLSSSSVIFLRKLLSVWRQRTLRSATLRYLTLHYLTHYLTLTHATTWRFLTLADVTLRYLTLAYGTLTQSYITSPYRTLSQDHDFRILNAILHYITLPYLISRSRFSNFSGLIFTRITMLNAPGSGVDQGGSGWIRAVFNFLPT